MKVVFLDYESLYSAEYSLRKMTPVEYVLDPRFEAIGVAVKEGVDGTSYWVDGEDIPLLFQDLDTANSALVYHNALFDACITTWRFGVTPRVTIDTLGIARATLGHKLRSLSLDSVARELGLGVKGGAIHKVMGMGAAAIKQAGLYDSFVDYALNDVELCAGIFQKLVIEGKFPTQELRIMDMVIRCTTHPRLLLGRHVLAEHLHKVQHEKDLLLTQAMMIGLDSKAELMSDDKFAEALRRLGVEPPTKISKVTGREAYAFSKTDQEFIALEDHENPAVQVLVAARLGHKSTLEETRTQRFINIGNLAWPDGEPARMPFPLRYSGAHTHRLSGDWSLNMQNLSRGGSLRRALIAPPNHVVIAGDLSQIEARMVAWLAGCEKLVTQFANKEDVYSSFATALYGYPVSKANPDERFLGKTAILGCGYGLGWSRFQSGVAIQSGGKIKLDDTEAQRVVTTYRTEYPEIPALWRELQNAIPQMTRPDCHIVIGPVTIKHESVLLPSGLSLKYHNLRLDAETNNWIYEYGGKTKKLYGGAFTENIVQALARIVVMDAAVRIERQVTPLGIWLALQVHDELGYVVPIGLAQQVKQIMLREMTRVPGWAPGLPLAAEVGTGDNYADAK
jgi:hypothetical protein